MKLNFFFLSALLLLFASCSKRNLAYISDIQGTEAYTEKITNTRPAIIKPDDLLGITVSSLNPEANAVFNKGSFPTASTKSAYSPTTGRVADTEGQGYLVDEDGYIDFPVLNKVKLGGLTRKEAQEKLTLELQKYLKDPTVNLRHLNYRITVIGEVNRPSTFTIPNERINILEALGMAGDMTAYGKRENVLLIREVAGERTVTRLNLNGSEILNSPYFYLQQNDVVYVEPVEAKATQASNTTRNISLILSAASVIAIILTRIL